jgi:hypothetical protein
MLPNAWFYYVIPFGLALAFAFAGWRAFRHGVVDRSAPARVRGPARPPRKPAKRFGLILMLISGSLAAAIVLTSPTPWARQRLFDRVLHAAPDQIERLVIKGGKPNERPLTASDVTIDDPATLRQVVALLHAAKEVSPNHPRTRWAAPVEMLTRDGVTSYFTVTATEPCDANGTLVNISYRPPGRGWNLGDVRADGLDALLEAAVRQPATTTATPLTTTTRSSE